ncbi:MAG: HNH endonuclease [Candidatus Brocadia sp.]|nr:HNH endonuclease [Candidatus Brocadia sp.]
MNQFYNISPGYDLAQRLVKSVYGMAGYYDYAGPCYLGPVDRDYWATAATPHKWTLLHSAIFDFEKASIDQELDVLPLKENVEFFSNYIKLSGVLPPNWLNEAEIDLHFDNFQQMLGTSIKITAEAAFQLLFRDVEFLFEFQKLIRDTLKESEHALGTEWLNNEGQFHRPNYLPRWLEKAIYHRDIGHCRSCGQDVSGEVFHYNQYHLDHMLPLSQGGCNDPTNFQLLCKECNLSKGGQLIQPTNRELRFWKAENTEP